MELLNDKICKDRLITFQKIAADIKMEYRKKFFKKSRSAFENRLNGTDSF